MNDFGAEQFKPGRSLADPQRAIDANATADAAPEAVDALEPIAIIGLACRFPGARNPREFWDNLCHRVESIRFFSRQEQIEAGIDPRLRDDPRYVPARGTAPDVNLFDHDLFGFSPREAELTDPQHRVFLQCAWESLDDAGWGDTARYDGRIGVFAGCGANSYLMHRINGCRDELPVDVGYQVFIGNDKDFLPTRVSYKLGLTGPSVCVSTACSTSLVAVQMACQSLWAGQSDMALAGAVSIQVPLNQGHLAQEGGIGSPDGHCRPFDRNSAGTVGGDGCGVVLLKRLDEAIADGDSIRAVIRGAAVNNDGAVKMGYTAPSIEGQTQVIAEALDMADVDSTTISFVEAHGTGTPLGDPIEVKALCQAFAQTASKRLEPGSCLLGAVKANIGHLDTAAGMAGLIKAVLSLQHRRLTPQINFDGASDKLDLHATPFRVSTEPHEFPSRDQDGTPLRCSVSSFGIGGTNAHVVLEEAPAGSLRSDVSAVAASGPELLVLSAQSPDALNDATDSLIDELNGDHAQHPSDVAWTLQSGRRAMPVRRHVVWNQADRAAVCRALDESAVVQAAESAPGVVMMFPGQTDQSVGMAQGLYEGFAEFRKWIDHGADRLQSIVGTDLRRILWPELHGTVSGDQRDLDNLLSRTDIAQPALLLVEYAMARLWQSWGITPAAVIGHSLGEYTAACVAGMIAFDDALTLVARRGQLVAELPSGAMLAVPLPECELSERIDAANRAAGLDSLFLAVVNAPDRCVVSGTADAIDAFESALLADGITGRRLNSDKAFHSALVEPAMEPLQEVAATYNWRPPSIPLISNVTGCPLSDDDARDPGYWSRHLRQCVRFADGVKYLVADRGDLAPILLEVGPGRTLSTFTRRHTGVDPRRILTSIPDRSAGTKQQVAAVLDAAGNLWDAGIPIQWDRLHDARPLRRVPLPVYPFRRNRCWLEPSDQPVANKTDDRPAAQGETIAGQPNVRLYQPVWQQDPLSRQTDLEPARCDACWIVFADESGVGDQLIHELRDNGVNNIVAVRRGQSWDQSDERSFYVHPRQQPDYQRVQDTLFASGVSDREGYNVVYLWNLDEAFANDPVAGFAGLLCVAQTWGTWPLEVTVATRNLFGVTGIEVLQPAQATTVGATRVVPLEFPQAVCRTIDIDDDADRAAACLMSELRIRADRDVPVAAWRHGRRWRQTTTRLHEPDPQPTSAIRPNGAYWVTGGLSGIGWEIAQRLASEHNARLVLTSRSGQLQTTRSSDSGADRVIDDNLGAQVRSIDAIESECERELAIRLIESYDGLVPALRDLCARYVCRYLRDSGVDLAEGHRFTRAELLETLRVLPKFEKFVDFLVQVTVEQGLLNECDGGWDIGPLAWEHVDPLPLRDRLITDHAGFAPMIEMVDHCAQHYVPALRGEIEAIGVLYPDGRESMISESGRNTVEHVNSRVYCLLAARLVRRLAREASGSNRPLRILEVGGGTGYLTGIVLNELDGLDVEYHFTDLGKSFVSQAKSRAVEMGYDGFMSFQTLDISADPIDQGFAPAGYDVVLALDVVHATPRIRDTVANIRRLLAPHGALLMVEATRSFPWNDMVWGLAEGWWYFEDDDLRTTSPLMPPDRWEYALSGLGFDNVTVYPRDAEQRRQTNQALVVAQQPATLATERAQPQEDAVAQIARLGGEALIAAADCADEEAMQRVAADAVARFGRIDGVIHAAAVDKKCSIQRRSADAPVAEFAPKVDGTRVLLDILHDHTRATGDPLDFVALCSSITAVKGGAGQAGYCAANAYLAAIAQAASRRGQRVITIDWSRWQSVGMAVDFEQWHEGRTGQQLRGGMTRRQGLDAFEHIVSIADSSQVIVALYDEAEHGGTAQTRSAVAAPSNEAVGPERAVAEFDTQTERAIATVWRDVLGVNLVGPDDDFAELGGDSLIAIQVVARLREFLPDRASLSVRDVFEHPTIARLAARIESLPELTQVTIGAGESVDADSGFLEGEI